MPGIGDILKLMSHSKELAAAAMEMKNELPKMEFNASGANGGVQVVVGGNLSVRKIMIAPEMLRDPDYLAQELTVAVNTAMLAAKNTMRDKMKVIAGGMGIELPNL